MAIPLKNKKLFLLDMDGTIYLGNTVFEGTKDFLSYVKGMGGRYIFLTNNSSRGKDAYVAKMKRLGIDTVPEDFLSSVDSTIDYLKEHHEGARLFVLGTRSLRSQLRDAGFFVADRLDIPGSAKAGNGYSDMDKEGVTAAPESIDIALLGFDTELTYDRLENFCILLNRGCRYIATHPDMVCPVEYGNAVDIGCYIDMLKTATGREPDVIIGKPQPVMAYTAMKLAGFSKDETCIVGDRLYTDIACANNAGVDSILVLSGESTVDDIEKFGIHPTYIFDDIKAVLDEMKEVAK